MFAIAIGFYANTSPECQVLRSTSIGDVSVDFSCIGQSEVAKILCLDNVSQ